MHTGLAIKRYEPVDGKIEKRPATYGSGHVYTFRVNCVTEEGSVVEITETHQLLRDAKADLASMPREPKHPTLLIFHDGQYVGRRVTYSLGGPR